MGHDIILSLNYHNLGNLLAQLQEASQVQASPALVEKIGNAILFHQQLANDYAQLLQEHHALKQELSALTRDAGEIVCGEQRAPEFSQYEQRRAAGMDAHEIYWAARQAGLEKVELIKMLQHVFQLSLRDAQKVIAEAEQLELKAA